MPKNKKTKTDKLIDFLGGRGAVKGELGLLGIEQLYSLLGIPLPFAQGGAVGSPPVYETNDPKEAVKEIVRRTPFLSGAPDMFPIYADENSRISFNVGRPGLDDFQIGLSGRGKYFGDIGVGLGDQGIGAYHSAQTPIPGVTSQISYDENRGPRLDLMYQKRFADGGGVKSGPPPKRGPMPQGLETLFQKR